MLRARFFVFLSYWFVASPLVGNVLLNGQGTEDRTSFRKLDNGLAVVLIRKVGAPTIMATCGFKAGGVDDPPGFNGTAHLVEHLLSRAMRAPLQTAALYGELSAEYAKGGAADPQKIKDLEMKIAAYEKQVKGMDLNAVTTFDFVHYYGTFSPGQVELFCRMGAELLTGRLPEGVEGERGTLLDERKREYGPGTGNFVERIQALTFGDRPYGRPVAGRPNEIMAITPAVASDFMKKHYVPNNCVLVFVGDLDPNALFPLIEKYFGNFPRGEEPPPIKAPDTPAPRERRLVLETERKAEILIQFNKPAFPHKDDLVARVLGMVMTRGDGSRLHQDLITNRKIADEAGLNWGPGERFENVYGFSAVPSASHPPEEVEAALLEQLERLKTDLVGEDELRRAKGEIANDLDVATHSALQLAIAALRYQLIHGDWGLGLRTRELCQDVTPDDIREYARKYFTPENRTTITFMKKGRG